MSDARPVSRAAALLIVFALAGLLATDVSAQAQPRSRAADASAPDVPSAAALRARLDSARRRAEQAESTYRARLRESRVRRGADTTRVGPVTVSYAPSDFPEDRRRMVVAGIERAVAALEERFGADGARLLDSTVLDVFEPPLRFLSPVYIRTEGVRGEPLGHTVTPDEVERYTLRKAAVNLPDVAPVLARFSGPNASFEGNEGSFEDVARELALSRSTAGRRCFTGDLAACRALLVEPASDAEALELWFEPADYRAVVAFGARAIPAHDTARQAARADCEGGDDAACERLVTQLPVRNPHSAMLRITLTEYALEIAPRNGVSVLADADPESSPVAALARAAGVQEDSLVAGWRRRAIGALEAGRPSPVLLVASTAFWGLLLLELAIRRRPL